MLKRTENDHVAYVCIKRVYYANTHGSSSRLRILGQKYFAVYTTTGDDFRTRQNNPVTQPRRVDDDDDSRRAHL